MENEGIVNDWQFCTQCGTKNVGDAKFCKSCGYPLTEQEPSISSEQPEVHVEPEQKQESTVNAAENNLAIEHSEEVLSPWSGWLLLLPVIGWVVYRLAILSKGDISLMVGMVFIPNVIAEALGGAFGIVGLPLIVTAIIYIVKKTQDTQYTNFVKHSFIASILMLALGIASNIHAIHDEQKAATVQTTSNVIDTAPAVVAAMPATEMVVPVADAAIPAPAAQVKQTVPPLSESEQAERDCNVGNTSACIFLANSYKAGEGVKQDNKQAAQYYKKACDRGSAKGCYRLGTLYDTYYDASEGVKQDNKQAAQYYKKACDGDDADGCVSLGAMYGTGQGVKLDGKQHIKYYKKGCDGGRADACKTLGDYYKGGRLIGFVAVAGEDKTLSAQYYKKGCDGGDADACQYYQELQSQGY